MSFSAFFHAERERREAVGHKVDPEQVHRLEDREAQERGDEDADDLAHVRAEQELDGLADVVVNAAAFLDRADDRGEVVVREHHVGHVFRHVRTGDAHADADVGGLDGGASFTPSPVMAVTYPALRQALTMRVLCSGCTRA